MPDFTKGGKLESDCFCFQASSCLSFFVVTQILSLSGVMPGSSSCFSCISPSANSLTSPSSSFPFHILTSLNFIENRCGSYSPCPIGDSFERKGSRDILTPATQCPEPLMSCSLILDMGLVSGHVWLVCKSVPGWRQQCCLGGCAVGEGGAGSQPSGCLLLSQEMNPSRTGCKNSRAQSSISTAFSSSRELSRGEASKSPFVIVLKALGSSCLSPL